MADLVDHFKALGVDEPEEWAASQKREGIDQLSRATLLRAFADRANSAPTLLNGLKDDPRAPEPLRRAAKSLADLPLSEEDRALIAKGLAYELAFDLLALIDGSAVPDINPEEAFFALYKADDQFKPVSPVEGLHESWTEVSSVVLGEEVVSP